ncbi:putative RNA-directed DNA polymerase from mobile element jockey-like [Apostichopus japonicus]|uniref:Putative RNA-directed DNA polymerase from mobile element jockey-like n=1 Tax=Stichopus japonicus TaxID=307972 RepID=A0A2G8JZW2_STIJA|nr:putative RNA-directed DNA polymerase from mobile element jockey-like [Apostichopus japonicus]
MGVSHQVLCWVDAFLSDREQSVVVNGSRSNPSKVTSGVPQGSVLGPILFLAYINDIGNAVSSGVRLFADDCVCYRVIDDVSDGHQLQEDINILGQWAKDWGMSFQTVKCNIMTITRKRKPVNFNYMLNGVHLVKVDCIKYLGIHITSDLNWGKNIQNVCNKGNRILGVLCRNLSPCSKDENWLHIKVSSCQYWNMPVLSGSPPSFLAAQPRKHSEACSPFHRFRLFKRAWLCLISVTGPKPGALGREAQTK